jgi:RimJ/RimL family protein N-acetyltransferase
VGSWILDESQLISKFASWRAGASQFFFAQIKPTPESMTHYLQTVSIGEPKTILFALADPHGNIRGHLGIRNASNSDAQIDSIMKDPTFRLKGAMYEAVRRMILDMNERFGIESFRLQVLSTNKAAISLYQSLGFIVTSSSSLNESWENGAIHLAPTDDLHATRIEKMLTMNYFFHS